MKPHTKLYLDYFGLDISSHIQCEVCSNDNIYQTAVDIHHINARGMGGTKKGEDIKNLIALCREHHDKLGDRKEFKEYLTKVHLKNL